MNQLLAVLVVIACAAPCSLATETTPNKIIYEGKTGRPGRRFSATT